MQKRTEFSADSVNDAIRAISARHTGHPGDDIILLCGRSESANASLAKHIVDAALREAHQFAKASPRAIPAIYVEAPRSVEYISFWHYFYEQILAQLGNYREPPEVQYQLHSSTGRIIRPHRIHRNTLVALRTAVEIGLRERQVQFLVIDEAAHILHQTSGSCSLEVQLGTLKSLADLCGTLVVLVGSLDSRQLVSLSPQLARRTHVLHLEARPPVT
ncbi:TniB family NTP-binding protein [Paraburkholderia bryophila]|uniref:AAA domain-containing protein n=1 Tax=Paraburkholderia bryophila TaxID=420952 RepID=A0A329C5N0_9BURK|nr:TniB family NTP-binding protein [Paraburkholderia bryophila]RAS29748.1 AAA domain-containing protein [Paraburkholderia bryophila]